MCAVSVVIENLCKTYRGGVNALHDVSLEIGPGVFGLLGPNGAGKTTLTRTIATLVQPTSGRVLVEGLDVQRDKASVRALLGYLPQKVGVYSRLSAFEHVLYFAHLKGLKGRSAAREAEKLLDMVGLLDVARRRAGTLSGGMKQRLGIATALIDQPSLLVVDEPTAGLDPEERTRFRTLLGVLAKDITVILSTHIVQDVEIGCSRVAVMAHGRVLRVGTPEELVGEFEGCVWSLQTDAEALDALQDRYSVMSVKHRSCGGVSVRLVGGCAPESAVPTAARLEDAYVGLVHGGGRG